MQKETARERTADTDGVVIREKAHRKMELQQNLIVRLNHLKVEARDVCQAYLSNLDADIARLTEFVEGTSDAREAEKLRSRRLPKLDKILDGISIKPARGRSKDLRRIAQAVELLMERSFE